MWLCDVFKTDDIGKRKPKIMFSKPLLIELITNEDTKIVYLGRGIRWTW